MTDTDVNSEARPATPAPVPASDAAPSTAAPATPDNAPTGNADGSGPATGTPPPRPRRGRGGRGRRGGSDAAGTAAPAPGTTRGERRPQNEDARADSGRGRKPANKPAAKPERQVHPMLEKLAELYPNLFGARFLPLQRGIYEALRERHPEELPEAELKVALGLHARSGRYLDAIAQRLPRHSLDGEVVEAVAPEHVHHAIVELHRRRQGRTQEDLRPKLIARLAEAIEASGLDRAAYTEQARVSKPEALALIDDAFAEHGRVTARREALQRAFAASGQTDVDAFADMYGIPLGEARRFLKAAAPSSAA
ncbi:ProQ/FINO family protein [Xenophilus sp. Marseille-Q4582]|uniref:ProQ/FINO family protein n=1 Tax=Xenophilus sp. Marseille-Q4582 TaxID=2866600 RepID=UPI001CE475CF|nr:ProQ/FINO family protein [Xenophilus sp. Marseille-Q4582]